MPRSWERPRSSSPPSRDPYVSVIAVATVPALVYFLSVLFFVHIEAAKEGISLVPAEEVPALKSVLKSGGHLLLPAFLMVFVLLQGHSPNLAAVVAIYSIVVVIPARIRA